MDIEPDIEFFLHRRVCQFAFHIDESERFPAKTRTVLAALSSRTTRENMNDKHTASFKTARPAFKLGRSHKV
jgi:hypothetical protein